MIRIYGTDEETVFLEQSHKTIQIDIKTDQKVRFNFDEKLDIWFDFLAPTWSFEVIPTEDIEWEIRFRPFRAISMLIEIDCPNDTPIKYMTE